MAIKDFGESILADVRKRKDDQRKRDEGGTLGKIQRGLKTVQDVAEIGQSFGLFGGTAEDKYNVFKTNKAVMDTNINIGRAQTNAEFYDILKGKIAESSTSAIEYFEDQTINETVDKALLHPKNVQYTLNEVESAKFRKAYSSSLRGTDQIKVAAELAAKQYNDFGIVRDRFSQLGTKEEAMELAKSKIPNALRSMGSIFTGEDLNQAAVEGYTKNLLAQGASELEVFRQIFDETGGDLTQAAEIADTAGILKKVKGVLTTTQQRTSVVGDTVVSFKVTTDINGSETPVKDSVEIMSLVSEPARIKAALIEYNPQEEAAQQLTKKGQQQLRTQGFVWGKHTDMKSYENNVRIYNKVINAVDDSGTSLYSVPTVSVLEKEQRQTKASLMTNLYLSKEYVAATRTITNEQIIIDQIEEGIVKSKPKASDEEIKKLLGENKAYNNASAKLKQASTYTLNAQKLITAQMNEIYPTRNDDDAETADIKAGSTPKPTSLIKTTGNSLGVDNKNLLNVRPNVDKDDPWLGQSGVNQNYAVFESIDMGLRAGDRVLTTYGTKHGINTIEKVLNRFAPKGDGNDTESYIKNVSEKTGIARDEKIDLSDSSVRDALLSAMVRQETGENVSGDQIRAAVIRANETEEASSSTVTQEQVDAAVQGETPVNKISDADAKAWAKKNNYEGISVAQIRREHTAEVIADRDNVTIRQKIKTFNAGVKSKNALHRAKIKEMSREEKYYFNQTLNYPDRIVEMFKDGIPTPPITESNRSSSLLGNVNKKVSNYGVN